MDLLSPLVRAQRTLVASGLSKVYGQTVALWRVDVALRGGEILAIGGPNGSGKSTLLRVLAGLAAPSAGSVTSHAEAGVPAARTAFVGHATHLLGALTPTENLRLAARLARRADEPERWLEALGVGPVAHRRSDELSSGTQRRVALARALITDPDALLVDEPFAGLDDAAADLVERVLRREATAGRIIAIASHDSVRAARLAARSLRLDAGRVIETGVLSRVGAPQ